MEPDICGIFQGAIKYLVMFIKIIIERFVPHMQRFRHGNLSELLAIAENMCKQRIKGTNRDGI